MSTILPKERRQIEIISLLLSSQTKYSVDDLCEYFNVEVATIQRDLQDLRALGIPVHSAKKNLRMEKNLSEKDLRLLLSRYTAFAGSAVAFPKSTALLIKKLKTKSLSLFAGLVNAIENNKESKIVYYKMFDDEVVERTIEPYELFSTTRDWRLIARSDGIFKQFLVENIQVVEGTGRRFKRISDYDSGEIYRSSFEYWGGGKVIEVKLHFSKKVARIIKNSVWTEDQEVIEQKDGSVVLKLKVNSIEHIGNWVLTWGGDVKILKPNRLKQYVISQAEGLLKKNR